MRVLLVKTSSLGDVIHNLPVVSDIRQHRPDIQVDWCVEESCADIPRLHPGVETVIPVALRRWRKKLFNAATWQEISACRQQLRQQPYDLILDTQGLLKSALICKLAHNAASGPIAGHNADSAREPMAARFYDTGYFVPKTLHAVERNRRLAAAALGYSVGPELDYGITAPALRATWLPNSGPYVVLLTATSRNDKLWPEAHWVALGQALHAQGLRVVLPAGNPTERERAQKLATAIPDAVAAPPLNITELASLLAGAQAVVGVDTGLTHLAAALRIPTLALYTATDPGLTGVLGSGRFRNLGGKAQCPLPGDVFTTGQALGAW